MTVRRQIATAVALLALLFGAACSEREAAQLPAETDEPLFVQGVQLKKQGRHTEALTAFQKLIEQRGERLAPESHLEVGSLYLHHMKEPVLAYYHLRKYLELQPNSKEAVLVRGLVDSALRDFARRLPGAPREDAVSFQRTASTDVQQELDRLRRENAELLAEIQTLRGGGPAPRASTPAILPAPEPAGGAGVRPEPRVTAAPPPARPEPTASPLQGTGPVTFRPVSPASGRPAPTPQASRPAPQTTRATPPASGRTHTVAASDSLWKIARRYYSNPSSAQVKAIYEANRNVMRNEGDLRPGMVLRIP